MTGEVAGRRKRSLPPPVARFSAAQVATLYHSAGEIELGYRDIKSAMQHNAITLRSKKADLVYRELWGLLFDTIWSGGRPASRRSPSASAQ